MSSGRVRITCDSGSPTSRISIPDPNAVLRQPNSSRLSTTIGSIRPPIAIPIPIIAIAVARRRSNQFTIVTVSVMNPPTLAPIAISR